MPDKYDPYREHLVVETETRWSPECGGVDEASRRRIAIELHEAPAEASHLEYVRTHTGFCRRIVVTPADLERLKSSASEVCPSDDT